MAKTNEKLTSVKVDRSIFEDFKVACLQDQITLHKLVNTSLVLYLNDEEFRSKVKNNQ